MRILKRLCESLAEKEHIKELPNTSPKENNTDNWL